MARPIGVRPSYDKDAAFFLRLKESLGKDDELDQEWRHDACVQLTKLANLFINVKRSPGKKPAPAPESPSKEGPSKEGKGRPK